MPASEAPMATHSSMRTFLHCTGYNPYAPLLSLEPPVHWARTRRKVTPSDSVTLIASPLVSSTVRSSIRTPLPVTCSPSLPAFWFLKERMVLSMPFPRMVTFSFRRDRPMVKSKVPSPNSIVSPGLAWMRAVWTSSCAFDPGRRWITLDSGVGSGLSAGVGGLEQPVRTRARTTVRRSSIMDAPSIKEVNGRETHVDELPPDKQHAGRSLGNQVDHSIVNNHWPSPRIVRKHNPSCNPGKEKSTPVISLLAHLFPSRARQSQRAADTRKNKNN